MWKWTENQMTWWFFNIIKDKVRLVGWPTTEAVYGSIVWTNLMNFFYDAFWHFPAGTMDVHQSHVSQNNKHSGYGNNRIDLQLITTDNVLGRLREIFISSRVHSCIHLYIFCVHLFLTYKVYLSFVLIDCFATIALSNANGVIINQAAIILIIMMMSPVGCWHLQTYHW